jgi:hypothetical protein
MGVASKNRGPVLALDSCWSGNLMHRGVRIFRLCYLYINPFLLWGLFGASSTKFIITWPLMVGFWWFQACIVSWYVLGNGNSKYRNMKLPIKFNINYFLTGLRRCQIHKLISWSYSLQHSVHTGFSQDAHPILERLHFCFFISDAMLFGCFL